MAVPQAYTVRPYRCRNQALHRKTWSPNLKPTRKVLPRVWFSRHQRCYCCVTKLPGETQLIPAHPRWGAQGLPKSHSTGVQPGEDSESFLGFLTGASVRGSLWEQNCLKAPSSKPTPHGDSLQSREPGMLHSLQAAQQLLSTHSRGLSWSKHLSGSSAGFWFFQAAGLVLESLKLCLSQSFLCR